MLDVLPRRPTDMTLDHGRQHSIDGDLSWSIGNRSSRTTANRKVGKSANRLGGTSARTIRSRQARRETARRRSRPAAAFRTWTPDVDIRSGSVGATSSVSVTMTVTERQCEGRTTRSAETETSNARSPMRTIECHRRCRDRHEQKNGRVLVIRIRRAAGESDPNRTRSDRSASGSVHRGTEESRPSGNRARRWWWSSPTRPLRAAARHRLDRSPSVTPVPFRNGRRPLFRRAADWF